MNKLLLSIVLINLMASCCVARQAGGNPLTMGNSSTKIYTQQGSYVGNIRPISGGQYVVTNRYNQRVQRLKVNANGSVRVMNRAGH